MPAKCHNINLLIFNDLDFAARRRAFAFDMRLSDFEAGCRGMGEFSRVGWMVGWMLVGVCWGLPGFAGGQTRGVRRIYLLGDPEKCKLMEEFKNGGCK